MGNTCACNHAQDEPQLGGGNLQSEVTPRNINKPERLPSISENVKKNKITGR